MTVREHLQFYGRLKGNMSTKELDRDINEYDFFPRIQQTNISIFFFSLIH
jgi:hypothetical protein